MMDSPASLSSALGSGDNETSASMDDAMQNFIKNHVLSNPITCESTKTKTVNEQKEKRIKRPMNAFMVFSHKARKLIAKKYPNLKNSDLSKYLGVTWKNFPESEKAMFKQKAEELRTKHKQDHPQYKYQPRRKKSKVAATAATVEKPVRTSNKSTTSSKRSPKCRKGQSRSSESTISPTSSTELYVDESASPISDQSFMMGTMQQNFNFPTMENIGYEYYNGYDITNSNAQQQHNQLHHNNNKSNNGGSGNCNGSNNIHMNNAHFYSNNTQLRAPSMLTPPSTPINADLQSLNVTNGVHANLYNNYRNGLHEMSNDPMKYSPIHYTNYTNTQINANPISDQEWFNGFGNCNASGTEFNNEMVVDTQNAYNNGYDYDATSQKFNGDQHSNYFGHEKKFLPELNDQSADVPNSFKSYNMHYTNC